MFLQREQVGEPDPHKGGHYILHRESNRSCSDPPLWGLSGVGFFLGRTAYPSNGRPQGPSPHIHAAPAPTRTSLASHFPKNLPLRALWGSGPQKYEPHHHAGGGACT